jgi:hypothetical protein
MLLSSWLRNWTRAAPAARRRTQTSVSQQASFRPRLEALEDRRLLSGGGLHGTQPPHGTGGGSGGGLPYPTASTVSQLIADINYANKAGGSIAINLKPGTAFDLNQINNTTYSYYNANALPIIGGTKAVNLTILGNGDAIAWDGGSQYSNVEVRLLDVAQLGSLTLDDVTLQNGSAIDGGAVYNQGTLKVIDQSTLSGNSASEGGGIYNAGGTVSVSDSTLSGNSAFDGGGIYNAGGTVSVSDSTLSGNIASAPPIGYGESGGYGSGIYSQGGAVTVNNSTLSDNVADGSGTLANFGGTLTVNNSVFQNISPGNIDGTYSGSGNTGLP